MLMKRDTAPTLAPARPFVPSLGLRARWQLFRLLERLSALKGRGGAQADAARRNPDPPFGAGEASAWVFVSTIGELNAIEPFLRPFLDELSPLPVTLLTDRRIYRDSYLAKYPDAYVYEIDGTSADIERLVALTPPRLLLIAEIPCLLSDAPGRFPFATVHAAKRAGAHVALVNGWLYGYAPPSRLDAIERRLLGRDYLRLMDVVTVQTDEVRDRLVREGADPARVHVTGNTKFDAVTWQDWTPAGKRSEAILRGIVEGGRPCVVAGCVTDFADQVMVLDAFGEVLPQVPNALLVLAPRHPENREMMAGLADALRERSLRSVCRSAIADAALGPGVQVLILDTMGELKDFYGASTVSYVGRDHNILEPLAFGKPVTISPGWEAKFPSYSIYLLLRDTEAVRELSSPTEHAQQWVAELRSSAAPVRSDMSIEGTVTKLRGASARNVRLVRAILWSNSRGTATKQS